MERAQQVAAAVAAKYDLLECDECAKEIAQKLGKTFNASFERLRTSDGSDGIGLEAEGLLISKTGVHLGIRVGDMVFDNLHHNGVPAVEWPGRFVALSLASLDHQARSISDFFGKIFLTEKFRRWFVAG